MDIVRLVDTKILLVAERILEVLGGGVDYLTFEAELKKELDNLGCEILKEVLEALEQKVYESEERKRNWVVERKNDRKSILTPFGNLTFRRNYYRRKNGKGYKYLVDEQVGITPHMRVGVNLKASLAETSCSSSYEAATVQISRHNTEIKLSRQTVANCVREFKAKEAQGTEQKRCVAALYIEADEDHIKVRGRSGAQARLIYVHEGVEEHPRRHLKNARYFTTVDKEPEAFWTEIGNYIADHYELSSIKEIYLSGDGARWIQAGKEYIPGAIFILDKFHLAKYIVKATAHAPGLRPAVYKAIQSLNKQAVLDKLHEALELAEKPPRRKRIQDTIRYIENNWDGIESSVKHPNVGCSAEGHVSHILSERLSSRPMAWSLTGAGNMASMRAVRANGESVYEHYLAKKKLAPAVIKLEQEVERGLKQVKEKMLGKENRGNMPLLNGKNSLASIALKGLSNQMII